MKEAVFSISILLLLLLVQGGHMKTLLIPVVEPITKQAVWFTMSKTYGGVFGP